MIEVTTIGSAAGSQAFGEVCHRHKALPKKNTELYIDGRLRCQRARWRRGRRKAPDGQTGWGLGRGTVAPASIEVREECPRKVLKF